MHLNHHHRKFVHRLLAGATAKDAYLQAFPDATPANARSSGPRLAKNPKIQAELTTLREKAESVPDTDFLTYIEIRKFHARIVRACAVLLPDDSDLWNVKKSAKGDIHLRFPDKLRTLAQDAKLAGFYDPQNRPGHNEVDELADLLERIRDGETASSTPSEIPTLSTPPAVSTEPHPPETPASPPIPPVPETPPAPTEPDPTPNPPKNVRPTLSPREWVRLYRTPRKKSYGSSFLALLATFFLALLAPAPAQSSCPSCPSWFHHLVPAEKVVEPEAENVGRYGAMTSAAQTNPAERLLMGPGPSPVSARVLRALGAPTLGHLDPQYLAIMDETCEMLRQVFRTRNALTFPVSGTGMAGMECIAVNLLEPGDEAIVGVNGVFGTRMKDVMERCGATVHAIEAAWGDIITPEQVAAALAAHPKAKLLGIVHAETSTGAHQPLEGFSTLCQEKGALLVVDAVTSLGGHDLRVDEWGIDAIYSGTQKCLSCPPGLAPVSFSERTLAAMDARKTKPQSWYLDVSMLRKYYTGGAGGGGRVYHHTAPINMTYALREALAIVLEEGLEQRVERHRTMHLRLRAGLEKLGLQYIPQHSLYSLNCIHAPAGRDEAALRKSLLADYGIEIGAGLGPMAGRALRIGLMGHGATVRNVDLVLAALGNLLAA